MACSDTRLFKSDLMWVGDYRCVAVKGQRAPWAVADEARIIFVRRGVFAAQVEREEVLLSAAHALVLRQDIPFRSTHPIAGGDDCTVLGFTSAGWDIVRGDLRQLTERPAAIVQPNAFLRQQQLLARLRGCDLTGLSAEEEVWRLVDEFSMAGHPRARERVSPGVRAAVAKAQELIAASFHQSLPLTVIADEAGLSRFYLSRAFRRVTGFSMHRYQMTLRLRDAVRRLEAGATDLTELALDLGFSDHSHFTRTFLAEYGIAPSRYRSARSRARLTTPIAAA